MCLLKHIRTRRVIVATIEICLDEEIKKSMNLTIIAYYLFFFVLISAYMIQGSTHSLF